MLLLCEQNEKKGTLTAQQLINLKIAKFKKTGSMTSLWTFEISTGDGKKDTVLLSCDSMNELDNWLTDLNLVMTQLRNRKRATLAPSQLDNLREAFNIFDKDSDGKINADEIGSVMRNMGINPTDNDLHIMIERYDDDGNGTIEFPEFINMMSTKFEGNDDNIKKVFEQLDTDKDGLIGKQELIEFMQKLGEQVTSEQADLMIKEADSDNDGKINFSEFHAIMVQ